MCVFKMNKAILKKKKQTVFLKSKELILNKYLCVKQDIMWLGEGEAVHRNAITHHMI